MSARTTTLIKRLTLICLVGSGYAFIVTKTGWYIPCPVYALTRLYCPGCGVSRMCLALLRLDFAAAFGANPVLFCLLPVLAVLAVSRAADYIRTGRRELFRWQTALVWVCVGMLALTGLLRNIPAFSVLAPK